MLVAILQARLNSRRLPGKVLLPIAGKPLLLHAVERVRRAKAVDHMIVATSQEASDDALAEFCHRHDVDCFRGSLNDVLDRFYQAGRSCHADDVMRLTGDNPMIDPDMLDDLVTFYRAGDYDYASNATVRTFPRGLDAEVLPWRMLEHAWRVAELPYDREHVTTWHRARPQQLAIGEFCDTVDRSDWRWTVDEPADLEFMERVFAALYDKNPQFTRHDVHALLERRPDLVAINAHVEQLTGLTKKRAA